MAEKDRDSITEMMSQRDKGHRLFVQLHNGRIATMTSQQYRAYLQKLEGAHDGKSKKDP